MISHNKLLRSELNLGGQLQLHTVQICSGLIVYNEILNKKFVDGKEMIKG